MPKIRIYNITSLKHPPGFGLDFDSHYIPANPARPLIVETAVIPQILEEWQANGWCKVQDAEDKTPVTTAAEAVVTPGTQVKEVHDALLGDEEDWDLSVAKEAALTNEPGAGPVPLQPIHQGDAPKAKISLGTEDGMNVSDLHSPIPGDRPVSVDDSEQFTVRAPRMNGPGAVVRSS